MKRRQFVLTGLIGLSAVSLSGVRNTGAQQSTPVAGSVIENIRWELQQIADGNGAVLTPDRPSSYWIQFGIDGHVSIQADCHRAGGSYRVNDSELTFGEISSTKVLCERESIADQFVLRLGAVVSFVMTTDASDQLVLNMMADGGSLNFQPVLPGVVWEWVEFQNGDDTITVAIDPSRYTIEFLEDETVRVCADCNQGTGDARINGNAIEIVVATTEIGCAPDSQADDFLRYLEDAVSYVIRDGMLALATKTDGEIVFFRPVFNPGGEATPVATPAS